MDVFIITSTSIQTDLNSTHRGDEMITTDSSNTTAGPTPRYPGWNILPVFGLPGYRFHLIHVTALTVLTISIISSSGVLIYLNYPFKRNFFTRSIGE